MTSAGGAAFTYSKKLKGTVPRKGLLSSLGKSLLTLFTRVTAIVPHSGLLIFLQSTYQS